MLRTCHACFSSRWTLDVLTQTPEWREACRNCTLMPTLSASAVSDDKAKLHSLRWVRQLIRHNSPQLNTTQCFHNLAKVQQLLTNKRATATTWADSWGKISLSRKKCHDFRVIINSNTRQSRGYFKPDFNNIITGLSGDHWCCPWW